MEKGGWSGRKSKKDQRKQQERKKGDQKKSVPFIAKRKKNDGDDEFSLNALNKEKISSVAARK